jgi:hypothetical protein
MKLRNWLGVSFSLLVGTLVGCTEGITFRDYWVSVDQCSADKRRAIGAIEKYGIDANIEEISAAIAERLDPSEQQVSPGLVNLEMLTHEELCGVPREGMTDPGMYISGLDGDLEVVIDGELQTPDRVVVLNDDFLSDAIEEHSFYEVEYLLDFFSVEDGRYFLDSEKLAEEMRSWEDLEGEYNLLVRDFNRLYYFFEGMGKIDFHENHHRTLDSYDFFSDHLIPHEIVSSHPFLTYEGDQFHEYSVGLSEFFTSMPYLPILGKVKSQVEEE